MILPRHSREYIICSIKTILVGLAVNGFRLEDTYIYIIWLSVLVMNKQYHVRQLRVKEILETILKVKNEGLELDMKRFVFEISERYGCTERKAKEYLKIAELKLEYGNNAEQELHKGKAERVSNNQEI